MREPSVRRNLGSASARTSVALGFPETSGAALLVIFAHSSWVHSVAFSPNGARLAVAGENGELRVYPLRIGRRLMDLIALARSRIAGVMTDAE